MSCVALKCVGRLCLLVLCVAAIAAPSAAVVLATPDGSLNTSAPRGLLAGEPEDPGWANVGTRGGLTVIYLGDGWVITAAHVGVGSVVFGGPVIEAVPSSAVVLDNSTGVAADVRLFRIVSDPGLPPLAVSATTPLLNAEVVMVGHGRSRGAATFWRGRDGWQWASPNVMRWGTNQLSDSGFDITIGSRTTRSFSTQFDFAIGQPLDTDFEAQAANGDSGGAVFYAGTGGWELAGIMHSISLAGGQPGSTSLDGNKTFSADLAHFAGDIASLTAVAACSDGIDDDGDGWIDYPADPGCDSAGDAFETDAGLECDNGFDDDGDGLRDAADPGCRDAFWTEEPACDDGIDNDQDGRVDAAGGPGGELADPECLGVAWRNLESPLPVLGGFGCGLGFELVVLVPLLQRLRRRRR